MTGGSKPDDRVSFLSVITTRLRQKVPSEEGQVKICCTLTNAESFLCTVPSSKKRNKIENTVETKREGTEVFVYKRALKKLPVHPICKIRQSITPVGCDPFRNIAVTYLVVSLAYYSSVGQIMPVSDWINITVSIVNSQI